MRRCFSKNSILILAFFLCLAGFGRDTPAADPAQETSANQSARENFHTYQQQIQQEYDQNQSDILAAYETYQRLATEAYETYARQISRFWPQARVSTPTQWVEYSTDYQKRKIVDFDRQEITIDLIAKTGAPAADIEQLFQDSLKDLLQEDQQTAFKRNQLAQDLEQKIVGGHQGVKTGQLNNQAIVLEMMTDQKKPSDRELARALARLRDKAAITRQPSKIPGHEVVRLKTRLPANSLQKRARRYQTLVADYARQRGLNSALLLAVMHTESAFNPMARSPVPAYGLMQIVPQSAGKDVSKLLFGQATLLSPSYLYKEANNINIGATYLYILYYKYLQAIKNPTSRLYCTIAAYNTGPGNVARTFTGQTNIRRAAGRINQLAPEQVYQKLRRDLPYQETRDYLQRVRQRMQYYAD